VTIIQAHQTFHLPFPFPFPRHVTDLSATQDREREWLRQVARGDRAAYEHIYRAYYRRVFGYLYRMTSPEAAEELTSDVMLEVWKRAGTFRGESLVSSWIFGIARFKALSAFRRPHVPSVDVEQAQRVSDPTDLQDATLVKRDLRAGIRKALSGLSAEHQEVIELTFYQDLSYPEIARIIDCPVGTVKTRMFHARKQLREALNAEGVR